MTERSDRAERAAERAADKAERAERATATENLEGENLKVDLKKIEDPNAMTPSPPADPASERLFAMVDPVTREVTNLHYANPERWTAPPPFHAIDVTDYPTPLKKGDRLDRDGHLIDKDAKPEDERRK